MATIERAIPVGGASLNFKVVGGTAEPVNPKENTIWVNTDAEVTGWAFAAEEPAQDEVHGQGFLWIKTAALDTFAFNALKKNAIKVCPVGAAQMLDGNWVEKDAKIYQNGAWKNLVAERYVYNSGDTCVDFTGGWERYCGGGDFEAGSMYVANVAGSGSTEFGTVNKIDLTDVKQIAFYACATNAADNGGAVGASSQKSALNGGVARGVTKTRHESTSPEWYYLDTSNVEGSYYIYAHAYLWASMRVYAIKLIY